MKKFKNSRLSTDSRKLQTLALNLPLIVFKVKDSSHFSCVQPMRKYRLFLNTVFLGILGTV